MLQTSCSWDVDFKDIIAIQHGGHSQTIQHLEETWKWVFILAFTDTKQVAFWLDSQVCELPCRGKLWLNVPTTARSSWNTSREKLNQPPLWHTLRCCTATREELHQHSNTNNFIHFIQFHSFHMKSSGAPLRFRDDGESVSTVEWDYSKRHAHVITTMETMTSCDKTQFGASCVFI